MLLLAGAAVWMSLNARQVLSTLVGEHAAATALAMELEQSATAALSFERAVVARALLTDQSGMQAFEKSYRASRETMERKIKELRERKAEHRETLAVLDEMPAYLREWDAAHIRFWELSQKNEVPAAAALVRDRITPVTTKFSEQAARLVETEKRVMERASAESAEFLSLLMWGALAVAAVAMGVLLAGIWATRGGLLQLGTALSDLRRMADEVTQASGSLSSTSQALADGATRQAASTEETASSSVEVKAMAERNSGSAKQAAVIVTNAQEKFDEANRSLVKLEESMEGIGSSANKIARIIKVIDDIAFQTNILSLNAAVEAARAGDAGMGFAVVADEVRGLALRCATAAHETAELINESIASASDGKLAAGEVAATIRSVTEETESIRALVTEVSQGSEDQARAMDEIASAITQIERVTQDSAANAEEAAAASEELTAQASELRHIMERITELAGVGAAIAEPQAPAEPAPAKKPKSSAAPVLTMEDDDQDFRPF
jgi:methyl-accepting chemotaxis protein